MSLKGNQKSQYFMFFNFAVNVNFKVLTLFNYVGEVIISVMPLPTDKDQLNLMTNIQQIDTIFKP